VRANPKAWILALSVACLLWLAAWPALAADRAAVVYTEGTVTVDGAPADVGSEVRAGATVTTGKDSLCEIVFNTRNVIHLAAGTSLTFDPKVLSRGATLKSGAVAMVLRNLAPGGQGGELRFSIRTSTTIAGVRGTCFFVKVEDENTTYICCCNGAIHLEGTDGQFSQNVAAAHHRELRITRSGSRETPAPAAMLYHTDADVEGIAARIGEKVDWSRIE
jgi:hypothetical protein